MTSYDTTVPALPERTVRELAAATSVLVTEHDVVGTVTNLLASCAQCVQADAAGIVMARPDIQHLEFLAATDHRAQHLELYQVQIEEGPGVECTATGESITVTDIQQIGTRWPGLVEPVRTAGFTGIHAAPMNWHGRTLGAINLFFADGRRAADADLVAQAFADIAALAVIQASGLTPAEIAARTHIALEERTVVERAKGVLAFNENLPMDKAFDRLIELAHQQRLPLTVVAAAIVNRAATDL